MALECKIRETDPCPWPSFKKKKNLAFCKLYISRTSWSFMQQMADEELNFSSTAEKVIYCFF